MSVDISFTDIVPVDVTEQIVKQLDMSSFSKFLTTCRFVHENVKAVFDNKVFNNTETLLKDIIDAIIDYDRYIFDDNNKYHITQSICKSYLQNMINGKNSEDRDYLMRLTEEPIMNIIEKIDGTLQDIHIVWNQIASNEEIDEMYGKEVIKCIQEHLFTKEYNVIFNLVDKRDQIRYKSIFNITLSQKEQQPLLKIIIIDGKNEIDLCDNEFADKMNQYIKDAEFTSDGELQFTGTDENLAGFVRYMLIVFGNGMFSNKPDTDSFEIHICNFINQPFGCCDFYRQTVSDLQITKDVSKQIVDRIHSSYISNIS